MTLTWVQMRWSVGCRESGPPSPRYWVSRTRSPFWHDASAPTRKSSKPQPGGPWGESQVSPPTVEVWGTTSLLGSLALLLFMPWEVPTPAPAP